MELFESGTALTARAELGDERVCRNFVLTAFAALYQIAEVVGEARLAESSERHDFVFVRRVKKAEIRGELLVEQPQRVGHVDLAETLNAGVAPETVHGRA